MIETDHPPLYAWMVQAPDGRWGIMGANIPNLGMSQLVFGSRKTAETCRHIALQHTRLTKEPVRLVKFSEVMVLEHLSTQAWDGGRA